jgi:DNA-binding beta-propeller fold protein YncE
VSGPGDGVEGLHDPPTGSFDTAAIAAAGTDGPTPPRHGASRLMGHGASDRLSTRGPQRTSWLTPMVSSSIADGGYLRAMLGNVYFCLPIAGFVLGVLGGINTSGLAVPPTLWLTLVLVALGAFDALSGLCALVGFTLVVLVTGNLIGTHMGTAPPGEQPLTYTLTALFGLGVLWFAGAKVPQHLRPVRVHRGANAALVWSQRAVDYAASAILGTFVIWLAAWQMPTLAGNGPQELFVSIQDHLLQVKVVALVALLARVALQEVSLVHFAARSEAVAPAPTPPRPWPTALVFWAVRGAFAFAILWEYLGFGWMLWTTLVLFLALTPITWLGKRVPPRRVSRFRYSLHLLRIAVVVVLAELVLSQLTRHLVNPVPMLGGLLITIGALLCVFAFFEPMAGFGARQDWRTFATDTAGIVLVVLLVYGIIGFGPTPFIDPHGEWVSPTGAVIVADTGNNRLVLIHKNGYRETIPMGWNQPADVVADGDPNGWIYVADAGNNEVVRVRGYYKYTVGSHTFNLALGAGSERPIGYGLKDPQSVSVDGLGNVWVADTGNGRVVEINRTTLAQRTMATGLQGPLAVLCDPFFTKKVYVANTGAGTVLALLPQGRRLVRTVLLRGLDEPSGLAEDPWGNLYVAERGNGSVLEVTDAGHGIRKVIRTGLGHPRGLSVDALGNLFIADTDAGQVKIVASLREHILLTHGMPDPSAVAYTPSGTVFVTDRAQGWLQAWADGALRTVATGLDQPVGVAGGPHGEAWVDSAAGTLSLVDPRGHAHVVVRGLRRPRQLWAVPDGGGAVLVAEEGRDRIIQVTPSGATTVVLAHVTRPVGVASDPAGQLVVGLADGDVFEYHPGARTPQFLYNLRGIAAIAMGANGDSWVGSRRYRIVVMRVALTGRRVVVNRDFRSLTGLSATPTGQLWVVDRKSIGLYTVIPSPFFTQL